MESAADSRGLSILNPSPSLIRGPDLLQDLVVPSSKNDLPAIDYYSNTGNRVSISYSRLHFTATALAERISGILRSQAPLDTQERLVIPIIVPQSPALYVGLLAILKVGAAFCPLNLDTPRDRLRFILKDVGARIVLVDSEFESFLLHDDAYHILVIDQTKDLATRGVAKSPTYKTPETSDLAYIMYTSGSTGTPKGVGISHRAVTQSLLAHDRHIPSFTRFLQFAAPTFDVSVFEIFFPLFRGSTLVCCSRAEMLTDLPRVLRNMRIDACELTPSVAGSLLKKRDSAPGLRLLLTIGEMLTEPVIQEFGGDRQKSLLWGMYGPTEAAIHCTLQPAFSKESSKNNIGVPLDTVSAFIIESGTPEFRVLPLGHVGELAVGGSQIATGYINQPEQTSAAFVDTRWGRVYRTGDKARMSPDGTIHCLGRIGGGQVKLNGQRIELGEVEHALLRTPGCHGAVAVVSSNVLVAFAAVEGPPEIRAAIFSQCRSWLPAYMIPAEIKMMNQFPRLPSGKVDKKSLIEQYETASYDLQQETFEDDLERQLCEIAEAILGRHITPTTSLGLDSLAAIEYASRVRTIGLAISPIDILNVSTVRELFRIAQNRQATNSLDVYRSDQPPNLLASNTINLDDVERVERCSPLQEGMVAETLKDSRLYVNQTELHFPSHFAIESIKSWFSILAQRNEILRTGFAHLDHKLYQVIWKRLENQIEVVDRHYPLGHVEVDRFLRRPFKLEIIPSKPMAKHHRVILTLHHSMYDGWTIDLLIEDLSLLARGAPPVDRPQFRQVSQHLAVASGGELRDAKEFWAEMLRGAVPTPLPNFRTATVSTPQIATISKKMNVHPTLTRDFALQASIGPQVIFQACLAWLWAKVSGVDDTIIGSVSSGRALPIAGIEKIMGPCVTTLPLRTVFNRYTTVVELLQGVHTFNRDTLRYGSLPVTEIKRAAGVSVAQKLFDVIFAYQETLASRRRDSDIIREVWHQDAVEAKLLVQVFPSSDHFSCQITWHSDVFSKLQIEYMFRHLNSLIDHFVGNGNGSLSKIPTCFPVDSLSRHNTDPKRFELLPSLSRLVERSTSKFPGREALCFVSSIGTSNIKTHTLTYQELNSRANRIARHLKQCGATPGGIIALAMEKSILLYCAILGILKTGCAYLPILPSTPPQRIQLILQQAQPQFCLVDDSSPRQMLQGSVVDLSRSALSGYADSDLETPQNPTDLAYVIYTSGTTGPQKGVSVTNRNILSNIEVLSSIYPHESSDRMLQACSQAFDMSVFEIFFSWGNGMCLYSATNDTLFEDIERAVRALRITHLGITVTVASLLEPTRVPSVKLLATAGEPMTDGLLEKWAEKLWQGSAFPIVLVVVALTRSGYGPSETTNICTVRKVSRGDSSQYLGPPLDNTSAFVFSPGTTQLVPLGCVGELCFGGEQVAAGYLKMPELTAAKFFDHRDYGRLYRSGDVGRMLPDGSLIILGRMDTQVKLRGLRIELQEIQAAVLKSRLAKACTSVLVTARGTASQQLALFYVPISHESSRFSILTTDSTRQAIIMIQQILQAALPDYMVPSFIFPISALPLTSSGKVDHNLLSHSITTLPDEILSLCSSAQDLDEGLVDWTEAETLIAEAISEIFHRKVISRWTSFATLGIDSISAMPLARRLQTLLRKRIPLSLILSNPTVARLASAVTKKTPSTTQLEGRSSILPDSLVEMIRGRFERQNVENVLPCTPLQEAMLSSPPASTVKSYRNQMLFKLRLPSKMMKKYWDIMFERHGILRTCFVTTEDARHPMVQVVLKSYSPAWEVFKAGRVNFQDVVLKHGSFVPAPLDTGQPPVSLALVVLEDSSEYLSFVCHHAIYDGVSMRHLLSEVEAASRHEKLPLAPSFESFLRETLPLPSDTDDFWTEQFRSFSPFHFDKLAYRSSSRSAVVSKNASPRSFSSIASRLRDLGVSLLSLCQAAWSITLSLLQDDGDVCFGNVVSGRTIALDKIDTLVAPCFNTIPIRMNLSDMKFLLDVMKKSQQLNADVMPYQFTGLRRIQAGLPLSRLFDTVLILQPQAEPLDEAVWSLEQEYGAMDVPLVCEITPLPKRDVITLQLHRDPLILSHETSLLISDIFHHVFDTCLEHPSSHILTISRLPAQWQRQISQVSLTRELPRTDAAMETLDQSGEGEGWTGAELMVRSVLSKLTKVPEGRIRRHTSVYRYGLDSIGAVQFANLLRRESCAVSAVDVIENPTCAGIASRLIPRGHEQERFSYDFDGFQLAVSRGLGDVSGLNYEALFPCTPTQQGMISQFLRSEGTHYFNYTSLTLKTDADPRRIVEAWAHLSDRHEILRTGFVPVNHQDVSYAMVVYPKADFSAPVSIRRSDDSEWRADAASKALRSLSLPPWQVVIVDRAPSRPTMHLAMHHALYDATSLYILLRELVQVIFGTTNRTSCPIQPALSICLDPVYSQPASEEYWKGKAADLVVNKFPTMTPLCITGRSALTASRMSRTCVRRNAAELGITVRAALQAAWTRVLSAYIGETAVTFGIVLEGRATEEERDVVFPMVTTLPVLARNSNSNAGLLDSMMRYNTSLRRHERTPLSKIQRWLGRPNSNLFDTILVYQTTGTASEGLPWEVLDETASVEYAVALEVVEAASNELQLNLTHDANILPEEQAHIILQQFDVVLADLVTNPQGQADQLPRRMPGLFSILPAAHQRLPPPAELLHQLVEQSAQRIPAATALEFVEELGSPIRRRRWTYRELDEMGNRVANLLIKHNTPPGSIVATCFNKCPEAYFSILGVLKAGCAFLSLDPSAPASRLEFILGDSAAACLLIESELNRDLQLNTAVPAHVVSEQELFNLSSSYKTPPGISSSDTCYCLYTSGTTGTPKGCLISHDNTVQAMLAFKLLFAERWDVNSRWLQFASFHFDVSVLEQYWSWFVGITVVAAPKDLILSDITTTISCLEITHIDLTPSLARLIRPEDVPSLCRGVFITGGEQLRQEILQTWGPKEVIYNAYGPTEATIGVTMFRKVPTNGRPSNIGIQFPNVGTYVLDPNTEIPVLRGGVGELCVSGKLVGKGYLNRKDLTDERFPVLERCGERIYRTGDLVRVLYDNSFNFLGRADDQVKLRGQRLEIGEINHAIKAGLHGRLADVVTFVTRHLGQDRDLLVSFLAPTASTSLPVDLQICSDQLFVDMSRAAVEACRDRLPGYMVPTYILCVPFIPLSANNKADVRRLKLLFAEIPHDRLRNLTIGSAGAQRALGEKEQLIALAVSAVTRVKDTDVLPSSSLFELGIDSINVARLALILQSQGFALANPSLILRYPHISRLCQALQKPNSASVSKQSLQATQSIRACYHRHVGMVCRVLEIDKADVEYIAPCTPLQEGMIARSKAPETQSAYFNQFQIELGAHVSASRLKRCWDSVFAECAILRTAFLATTDGFIQAATRQKAMPWFDIDLKEQEIQSFASERRERWAISNRDCLRSPVEIDYLKRRGQQTLLLRLFHAVYDGHSFDLLLRRVNAKYHHEPSRRAPTFIEVLPRGPLLKHDQSREFWERIFKSHAFQPIPVLTNEPNTSDALVTRVFRMNGLEARRVALGVTHQTVVQAALLLALRQRLGFVPAVGIVFSGRSLVLDGVEDIIGPIFNTLPFRVNLSDRPTWASLVQAVQEYNASVLEYVHTPLRDIQKWCSSGQPLFDVLFTFNREDVLSEEAKRFWSSVHSVGSLDYPLAFEAILARDQSLKVSVAAQKSVATEASVGLLLEEFGRALTALARSDNDAPLPSNPTTTYVSAPMPKDTYASNLASADAGIIGEVEVFCDSTARAVRHEVASLAGVRDEEVLEATSLFELGLDSIDSIKLATRLKRLGLRVTASELMKNPTIKSIVLSHSTADANVGGDHDTMSDLKDSTTFLRRYLIQNEKNLQKVTAILPPTPLQDSMVADMLLSGFRRYFNHDVLEIPADTDVDRLKAAWALVYANSPILRTTFAEVVDPRSRAAFCQIVLDEPLEFKPTAHLSSFEDISTVIDRARARAANLGQDLFQLTIATTPKSRYVVLSIAHALYDGWSLELLHNDVRAAYEGHYHTRDAYEPYLARLLFDRPAAGESFWADYLSDARPTILSPVEPPQDDEPVTHRAELVSALDPRALKALCRRYRITPQVLAQGCWAPVLASMASSLDVTFGVVLSGRDTDAAQGLLFPTMNTVPLRVMHHGTVVEYFNYLQATISNIMEFQHLPLRELHRIAKFKGQAFFNTLFLLQNVKERRSSKKAIYKSVHTSSSVEYPVCVEMELTEDLVLWRVAANERYVSLHGTKQILGNIERVLRYFSEGHSNILEFDESDMVSICGLEPFQANNSPEDGAVATLGNASPWETDPIFSRSPVMDVLSELSGIDRQAIDPNHSIYHLGLDSISAIKASSMLRKRGVDITVRDLLKAPSIREIFHGQRRHVDQLKGRHSETSSQLDSIFDKTEMDRLFKNAGVDQAEVETALPALPIQVHMLSVWQNTGGLLFFPRFSYNISGKVTYEVVSKAWSALVAEMPMLRTRFASTGSSDIPFIQIITKPKATNPIEQGPPALNQDVWVYEHFAAPFVFVHIDNSAPEGACFRLHIHHALYDSISLSAIINRFSELCEDCSMSSPNMHNLRWHQFVLNHYSFDVRRQRQKFWTSYLRDIKPTRLLPQGSAIIDGQEAQQVSNLRANAIKCIPKLRMASSVHGASLQALFFAAYSKTLAVSQQFAEPSEHDEGVVFGIYLANRTSFGGLEESPFPTLNIVPLVVRNPLTRSIVDLAVNIQKDLLEIGSFENSSVGLWEIYHWTGIQIESSVNFLATPENPTNTSTKRSLTITKVPVELAYTPENSPYWDHGDLGTGFASRNEARKAFMHTVDIEVAVHGDGMDIGVFCPSSFSNPRVNDLIEDITNTLDAVS
ncbi:hypothetical protein F5Y13DRAFT_195049 [Hypoxylon sp. FL1857]|nr:hypothetical protein F5Y13DRAFT_195049 [Hypoxylon sp. FL1857]